MKVLSAKIELKVLVLGLLFFVVANPMTYDIVDSLVSVKDANGPTQYGVLLHAVVFMVLAILVAKTKML